MFYRSLLHQHLLFLKQVDISYACCLNPFRTVSILPSNFELGLYWSLSLVSLPMGKRSYSVLQLVVCSEWIRSRWLQDRCMGGVAEDD